MSINTDALVEIVSGFGTEAINEELAAQGIPEMPEAAGVVVVTKGVTNLGSFTRLVSDLSRGTLAGKDITELMRRVFPDNKIGDKHGPHYLSTARKGKYGQLRHQPPSGRRTKTQVVIDLKGLDEKGLKALAKVSPALKAAIEAYQAMPPVTEEPAVAAK